jgi:2Fe-2S ferredoxin
MPTITYIDSDGTTRTADGEVGSTVMETAIKNNVPGIEAECGGACACATCHVYIDEAWTEKVGGPSPMEEDMLDFGYDVQPNSRLSCQIKVTDELDGLVVRTPARLQKVVQARAGKGVLCEGAPILSGCAGIEANSGSRDRRSMVTLAYRG